MSLSRRISMNQIVTPSTLSQSFLECRLHEKLEIMYALIKANLKAKMMVFLSSCKQVRFVYKAFCTLQPGTTIWLFMASKSSINVWMSMNHFATNDMPF